MFGIFETFEIPSCADADFQGFPIEKLPYKPQTSVNGELQLAMVNQRESVKFTQKLLRFDQVTVRKYARRSLCSFCRSRCSGTRNMFIFFV